MPDATWADQPASTCPNATGMASSRGGRPLLEAWRSSFARLLRVALRCARACSSCSLALAHLKATLDKRAKELRKVAKTGRTHLMDAMPVTFGQELSGWSSQIGSGIERVTDALKRVRRLPQGGTAVGTGINTPLGFPQKVIALLAAETELPIVEAKDHFEAQANRDALVEASGALRTIAVSLTKINNDIRWMGSGPNTGLGELHIPDLQPGSSIMPGKVNPVVPEAVRMVAARVIGNDATVTWCGANGNLDLNVMMPALAAALLESIELLTNASTIFRTRCVDGITAKTVYAPEGSIGKEENQ